MLSPLLHAQVLSILKDKGAGGMETLNKEDVAEWGKTIAAEIAGPAETSSSPGVKVRAAADLASPTSLPPCCRACSAYIALSPSSCPPLALLLPPPCPPFTLVGALRMRSPQSPHNLATLSL